MRTKATPRKKSATTTAAIYCRISQDRGGEELGIERQRADCEKLAKARGWNIGPVYVDNDLSAFSGRTRPGYEQLLAALKAGDVGALVAWHPDRLHRSPVELEAFIDVVEQSGAQVATVTAGELDLSTASGRMTARIVGAVARHESEHKSERIRRQREQAAMAGRPHGGRRAFGYDRTGCEIIDSEAALIREAARALLDGESLRTIATEWNTRKVRSSSGGPWTITSLRSMLTGPRLAGLRVHRGEVVGAGTWPAILTRGEHDAIRAVLGNPRARTAGRPPTSLLGGLLVCGTCGNRLHASKRINGTRRYMCKAQPGSTGCGRVAIQAERTEAIIAEAVLRRLDTPDLARVRAEPADSPASEIPELEARLAELADLFGAGDINKSEWMRARHGIEERLDTARAALDSTMSRVALAPYSDSETLRDTWPTLTTDQQRAVLTAVVEHVLIAPAQVGGRFEPERISVPPDAWRV